MIGFFFNYGINYNSLHFYIFLHFTEYHQIFCRQCLLSKIPNPTKKYTYSITALYMGRLYCTARFYHMGVHLYSHCAYCTQVCTVQIILSLIENMMYSTPGSQVFYH